jgi:hypothetical protein
MKVISGPGDGHGLECEFCGCELKHSRSHSRRCGCSLEKGIWVVKCCQHHFNNWNPRRPRTPLSRCLYERVASGIRGGAKNLRLFLAFGTSLDPLGIDFFFECCRRVVTVDLTAGHKSSSGADIILTRDDFVSNRHYIVGDEIAERLS